jgi:hypothetical protein
VSEALKRISRRTLIRSAAAAGILLVGVVAVRVLQAAMHATFDKPPAPLAHKLTFIKRELGHPVRYVATEPDEILEKDIVDSLGTPDYLVRQYTDTTKKPGEPGWLINLNLNYYPTGDSTPHVPEICWAGGGWQEADNSRNFFSVPNVQGHDGRDIDLRMRLISFVAKNGQSADAADGPVYSNVGYVFHVNGNYVAGAQEVVSQFWRASYFYAYHCKIEVTPMEIDPTDPLGRRKRVLVCSQQQAQQIISDFIREALPEVEACLPDRSILTTPPGSPKNATEGGRKN